MSSDQQTARLLRHHHITLCTGGAQEDYAFHTRVLGLRCVKKTLIYDGRAPIYHLYYGNDVGAESTLVTCFPMRHTGRKARPGTGQISEVALTIPEQSIDYWKSRLDEMGFRSDQRERFGEQTLHFAHPCGIDYVLAAAPDAVRDPSSAGPVPVEHAIRGTHAYGVSTRELGDMDDFLQLGWTARRVAEDRGRVRYAVGSGGPGTWIDLCVEPSRPTGTWTFGEGAVHHGAFHVESFDAQGEVKAALEGLGFTDCSDVKDRGYFHSVYVRTPSGALFEAAVSKPEGFSVDESPDRLGQTVMIAPQFEAQREKILSQLEPLTD